ncbi:MAG: antibiotic biosynthesis monooxygenase family protein [Pseudomonadota bacterium]
MEFQCRPEKAGEFAAAVRRQARNSLELEPGCLVFDVARAADGSPRFFLYEQYESAEAFETHLDSRHFADFDRVTAPWVSAKQVATWRPEPGE